MKKIIPLILFLSLLTATVRLFAQASGDPVVHQGVSPNGDGVNDILTIDNIKNFPDNKVTILNSNGATIFEVTGYNNGTKSFNGYSTNGVLQKEGTYYYVLKYNDKGETKTKTGYIVLRY